MAYFDKYGVEYSDDRTILIKAPQDLTGEYVIESSVKKIGFEAFCNCNKLISITVPEETDYIDEDTFYGCENLILVHIANLSAWCRIYFAGYFSNPIQEGTNILLNNIPIKELIIPDDITTIKSFAFVRFSNLKSLTLPSRLRFIGNSAFARCYSLERVNIFDNDLFIESPSYLESIGDNAFSYCSSLTAIRIPEKVENIGKYAFAYCTSLRNVEMYNQVENIEDHAFEECQCLSSINLGGNVTKIGKRAFSGCHQLVTIKGVDNVESIEDAAFYRCFSLSAIDFESVHNIGPEAFAWCKNLTSIIIPPCATYIWEEAFRDCRTLNNVEWNAKNCGIEWDPFKDCISLTTIKFGKEVSNIPQKLCGFIPYLKNVIIETNKVYEGVWNNCFFYQYLSSVTIKENILHVYSSYSQIFGPHVKEYNLGKDVEDIYICFSGATDLLAINIDKDHPSFCSVDGVVFSKDKSKLIAYPNGRQGEYAVPLGVRQIEHRAFCGAHHLTTLTLPSSIVSIKENAFYQCESLGKIFVPIRQKGRFMQMDGLQKLGHVIYENCEEEQDILLNVAKAYELGIGLQKDLSQAMEIYQRAIKKGSIEAKLRLEQIYVQIEEQHKEEQLRLEQERARKEEEARRIAEQRKCPKYIFFDTETTGLPPKNMYDASPARSDIWPRLVQIAWLLVDNDGNVIKKKSTIIYPEGFSIPKSATDVHHITTEHAKRDGLPLRDVLEEFMQDFEKAECLVAHNMEFDQHIIGAELYRLGIPYQSFMNMKSICTMRSSTDYCAIPNPNGYDDYKWPKLEELYDILFSRKFDDAHDALADITATKECFFELKRRGII